ncbi:Glycosyl transferase family 2 [Mariniphaga anaerophila]|uniref:Glycosyl transferase family 2 n=2 Tax=Mariniphaga anaerophila TaxID=1484053 RepID=A0A1M4XXE5_9BACT|nr:Glycosyl transferase family 2 [Mariniphaga anaerophila]
MLSVNIPVYNIDVRELVGQITKLAETTAADIEIRVYDDGSDEPTKTKNRQIKTFPGVIYRELEQNLGRAAIRNKMGLDSESDYLLFIDADSKLVSENYLNKYIENAHPGVVLCGGTAYSEKTPADEKLLRWVYGQKREAISAVERNTRKGFIITSNNFLIDREVFKSIHFRENLGPYGHEDTLLGYDLFNAGVKPGHIDNPVEHTGLEDSQTFLNKTKTALENLLFISENVLDNSPEFRARINFLKQYHKITKLVPLFLIRFFFDLVHPFIERNLLGKRPSLLMFDMYKLGCFSKLKSALHK